MSKLGTPERIGLAALLLLAGLLAIGLATRQDPAEKPYLAILGGGFVFNYRVADVFYGFSANVQKPLQAGSIIEAEFEDPAGGEPLVVSTRVNARTTRYSLRTPKVHGVKADKPYEVVINLYDFRHEKLIEQHKRSYASQLSDDIVPERPLTVGPGYARSPEEAE